MITRRRLFGFGLAFGCAAAGAVALSVASEAPVPDPGEHVPRDRPARHRDPDLGLGADRRLAPPALLVRAVRQLVHEEEPSVQGVHVALAMVADVHEPPADPTRPVLDLQDQRLELDLVVGPAVAHDRRPPAERDRPEFDDL